MFLIHCRPAGKSGRYALMRQQVPRRDRAHRDSGRREIGLKGVPIGSGI
jgi:hypothetical protein